MLPSSQQGAQSFCGFCGYADAQPFTFCPRCGRPVAAFHSSTTSGRMSENFGEAPTDAGSAPHYAGTQPNAQQGAGWPSGSFYGMPAGQTQPGGGWFPQNGGPSASGAPAQAARRPRKRWAALAGFLVLALLLGTGGVFAYTLFFAYNPVDTARYLPANTIFYSSLDLQQIAQNSHQISQTDAASLGASSLGCSTGLDFQKDIQPWVGRTFTSALVSITHQSQSGDIGQPIVVGTVCLISTHDSGKSNAAIQKIVQTQEQKYSVKFTSLSYGGVTLQSDVDSVQSSNGTSADKAAPLVLGTFKDQVLVASTVAVADQVIDRSGGTGSTLAQNATFTNAISKLPSDRFGTLYLNTSELLSALLTFGNNTNQTTSAIDTYPVGYGALQFTDAGVRSTFTLQAKAGTKVDYPLSGDTNAAASVVPASAILYGGLGNLSGYYNELRDSTHGLLTDAAFQQAVGLAPSDPLFNAPLSFAIMASPNTTANPNNIIDGLVILHSSGDPASADAKVQQALQHIGAHTSTSTISGVTVTTIQTQQSTTTFDKNTGQISTKQDYQTLAYYAPLGHDLVFGSSTDALSQAIATYQGKQASLAKSALFTQLVTKQPKTPAFSLFVSLDNLASAPGALGDSYRKLLSSDHSLFSKTRAAYLTYSWTDQGITITVDLALK